MPLIAAMPQVDAACRKWMPQCRKRLPLVAAMPQVDAAMPQVAAARRRNAV
jgi:hypothetical protein